MSDDEISLEGDLFQEPENYTKPPPEPHFAHYDRKIEGAEPKTIDLRLVGLSPLWGHLLWNAGIYTADYLDKHAQTLVTGKKVLELGAAAALPSLVCAVNGAKEVVSTDYPDPDLVSNIQYNFDHCKDTNSPWRVQGYIWGDQFKPLIYGTDESTWKEEIAEEDKFDLIILSDLVFNHTEHLKLLETCRRCLKSTGRCLVVFSPHRAWLLEKDLEFFETCKDFDFEAEKIDLVNWKPMFEEDEETADIRARVYSFFLNPKF